jgi:hypothetical protein
MAAHGVPGKWGAPTALLSGCIDCQILPPQIKDWKARHRQECRGASSSQPKAASGGAAAAAAGTSPAAGRCTEEPSVLLPLNATPPPNHVRPWPCLVCCDAARTAHDTQSTSCRAALNPAHCCMNTAKAVILPMEPPMRP